MSKKNYVRPGEVIGGGYFVVTRSKKTGRILLRSNFPFEHGSHESALEEVARLEVIHPELEFHILRQVE